MPTLNRRREGGRRSRPGTLARRSMVDSNTLDAGLNQLHGFAAADAGGDDEHMSGKTGFAGVVNEIEHAAVAHGHADGEAPDGTGLHGAMAVLRQVHEDLHEAVAVRVDAQARIGDGPPDRAADFGPTGLNDDAEIVENLLEGDAAGVTAFAVGLKRGEPAQSFDERFEAGHHPLVQLFGMQSCGS